MTFKLHDSCPAFTEAVRLKQVGLVHADVSTPGEEVGCVVPSEEGPWRGVTLARNLSDWKELNGKRKIHSEHHGKPCDADKMQTSHLAERRGAALGHLGLQDADELAKLHAVVQVLHEKLGSHLLSWKIKTTKQMIVSGRTFSFLCKKRRHQTPLSSSGA